MNLSHIEAFVLVAEHGSFSRASQASFISVSVLSKRIKTLEQKLGVTLLERSGDHGLTPEGRALIGAARKVIQAVIALEDAAREARGLETGQLIVGYTGGASYEDEIMAQVIANLSQQYPNLTITPRQGTDTALDELMDVGEVDIIIRTHAVPNRHDVQSVLLGTASLKVMLPKNHPKAKKMSLSLRELDGETFAMPRREDFPATYDFYTRLFAEAGITNLTTHPVASHLATNLLVTSGQLISFSSTWHNPFASPKLTSVVIRDKTAKCPVSLIWLKGNTNPTIAVFVEEAKRVVAEKYGNQTAKSSTKPTR